MSESKGQFTKEIPMPKKLKKFNLISFKENFFFNDDQSRIMEGKLV